MKYKILGLIMMDSSIKLQCLGVKVRMMSIYSCGTNSDYVLKKGPQWKAYDALIVVMVIHMVFNGLFIISRRVLMCLIKKANVTLYRLCYTEIIHTIVS